MTFAAVAQVANGAAGLVLSSDTYRVAADSGRVRTIAAAAAANIRRVSAFMGLADDEG